MVSNNIFTTKGHIKSACPARRAEREGESRRPDAMPSTPETPKHGRRVERDSSGDDRVVKVIDPRVIDEEPHSSNNKKLGGRAALASPHPKTPSSRPANKPTPPKVNHQTLQQNMMSPNGPVLLSTDQINSIFRQAVHPQNSPQQQSPGGNFVSCVYVISYILHDLSEVKQSFIAHRTMMLAQII